MAHALLLIVIAVFVIADAITWERVRKVQL